MLVINTNTDSPYLTGESYIYQGNQYTIVEKVFKIKEIKDMDKQISVTMYDEGAQMFTSNFWKSDYGRNPNIYKDGEQYKLVEITNDSVIEAIGFEYDYKGFKQFNMVGGYQIVDMNMEFTAVVDVNKLLSKLNTFIEKVENIYIKSACLAMLNTYANEFKTKPAAHSHHHNYIGGLLQHTYEVVASAYALSQIYECNRDVVICAALYHDIMKIKEYTDTCDVLPYANEIGHVAGSAREFESLAYVAGVDKDTVDKIYHCILAHHGRKEWGSPVEPATIEAAIVHEADMISSRVNPIAIANKTGLKDYYLK